MNLSDKHRTAALAVLADLLERARRDHTRLVEWEYAMTLSKGSDR